MKCEITSYNYSMCIFYPYVSNKYTAYDHFSSNLYVERNLFYISNISKENLKSLWFVSAIYF